jgi:chemotaxis protein MotC
MGGAQTPGPPAPAEPADLDPRMKRLLSGAERSLAEAQKLLANPVFTPARSGDARP